jgi:hypothetical protein
LLKCRSHVIQDTRLNRPREICSPEVHYPLRNIEVPASVRSDA